MLKFHQTLCARNLIITDQFQQCFSGSALYFHLHKHLYKAFHDHLYTQMLKSNLVALLFPASPSILQVPGFSATFNISQHLILLIQHSNMINLKKLQLLRFAIQQCAMFSRTYYIDVQFLLQLTLQGLSDANMFLMHRHGEQTRMVFLLFCWPSHVTHRQTCDRHELENMLQRIT